MTVEPSGATSARYSPALARLKFVCRAGTVAVFPRGEDQQKPACGDLNGGELPLRHVVFLVGEEMAVEVSELRPGIEDLNPVGGVAITVKARASVISHKFRDVERAVRI